MTSQTLLACLLTSSVFLISLVLTNSSPSALVRSEKVARESSELLKIDIFVAESKSRPDGNTREKRGAKDKVKEVVKKAGEAVRQRATKENVKKAGKKIVEAAKKNPQKIKKVLGKVRKLGTGIIAGIVIGVIVLIAIIGVAFYFCRKPEVFSGDGEIDLSEDD